MHFMAVFVSIIFLSFCLLLSLEMILSEHLFRPINDRQRVALTDSNSSNMWNEKKGRLTMEESKKVVFLLKHFLNMFIK